MPQYIGFDNTKPDPKPVIGWYDTDFAEYPKLPASDSLLEVTPDQWAAHMVNPGAWAVSGGALIPYAIVLTPAQLAQGAYAAAIAAGVVIVSTGTPALNGTYAIDQASLSRITAEQVYIATTGTFTNGQTTRAWLDASGTPHVFPSTAEFTAFAETVAQYEDALLTAFATASAGAAWVAPAQPGPIL